MTFGASGFFFGPVNFEIVGPTGPRQKLIVDASYSKRNGAGLHLSAKDLMYNVIVSLYTLCVRIE